MELIMKKFLRLLKNKYIFKLNLTNYNKTNLTS